MTPTRCELCSSPDSAFWHGVYILHITPEGLGDLIVTINGQGGLKRPDGSRMTVQVESRDWYAPGHIELVTTIRFEDEPER